MRQEIAERDRPLRRIGLVERAIGIAQDAQLRQLWSVTRDRIVQREAAFIEQRQGGGGSHRLRHRRDSKDRVPLDRQPRRQIPAPHARRLHDPPAPPDQVAAPASSPASTQARRAAPIGSSEVMVPHISMSSSRPPQGRHECGRVVAATQANVAPGRGHDLAVCCSGQGRLDDPASLRRKKGHDHQLQPGSGRALGRDRHPCLVRGTRSGRADEGGPRRPPLDLADRRRHRDGPRHLGDALHRDAGVPSAGAGALRRAHGHRLPPRRHRRVCGGPVRREPEHADRAERRRRQHRHGKRDRRHALHRHGRHAPAGDAPLRQPAGRIVGRARHRHFAGRLDPDVPVSG